MEQEANDSVCDSDLGRYDRNVDDDSNVDDDETVM